MDYDPSWPAKFEELRRGVWPAVRDVALSIEHVGSTAVAGLAAKPIIDMDVGELGYVHRGNLGIEDREAFASPLPSPAHHLYVCPQSSAALANHLALRDFLRRNPEAVAEYGRVKRQLAARFATDMASYIAGKTDCILAMLRKMGFSESTLQSIKNANISSD